MSNQSRPNKSTAGSVALALSAACVVVALPVAALTAVANRVMDRRVSAAEDDIEALIDIRREPAQHFRKVA